MSGIPPAGRPSARLFWGAALVVSVLDYVTKRLAERLLFLPALKPDEAHALLDAVDCVLDAHPLGGMSSSFIAAANGVPTVSLPFEMPFGKWMSAIYDHIGVEGLTARSPDE